MSHLLLDLHLLPDLPFKTYTAAQKSFMKKGRQLQSFYSHLALINVLTKAVPFEFCSSFFLRQRSFKEREGAFLMAVFNEEIMH